MKHKLTDWLPQTPDFELFHIYCHQKDYRLCWAINEAFRFELQRVTNFLEIPEKKNETEQEKKKRLETITHARFNYKDDIAHQEMYVIANRAVDTKITESENDLFPTEKQELLIAELPRVDYFVQLYGQFETWELNEIEEKLNVIPIINAAQRVDVNTLAAYNNLMQ